VLNRRILLLALGVALAAGLAGMLTARLLHDPARQLRPPSQPPTDFTLPDPDGKLRRLSEWRGRFVLVNFWATWCPPCRHELPLLKQAQASYGASRLQVLGVSLDEVTVLGPFLKQSPLGFPTLVGGEQAVDLMNRYGHPRGSIPFSVLVGPDGRVLARKAGAFQGFELKKLLERHLTAGQTH